eukprot:snap_masked-scaffold_1-processed-gene-5.34-mRNA-1 protein AED:0.44 eAED:0.44 QI:0/-1/0/1/-1/1/1/0/619
MRILTIADSCRVLALLVVICTQRVVSQASEVTCREFTFKNVNEVSCSQNYNEAVFYVNEMEVTGCLSSSSPGCSIEVCGNEFDPELNGVAVYSFELRPMFYNLEVEGQTLRPTNFSFEPTDDPEAPGFENNLYDYFCVAPSLVSRSMEQVCEACPDIEEEFDYIMYFGPNYLWYQFDALDEDDDDVENNGNGENDLSGVIYGASAFAVLGIVFAVFRRKKQVEVNKSIRLMTETKVKFSGDFSSEGNGSDKVSPPAPAPTVAIVGGVGATAGRSVEGKPVQSKKGELEDMNTEAVIRQHQSKRKLSKRKKLETAKGSARSGKSKSKSKSKRSKNRRSLTTMATTQSGITILTTTTSKSKLMKQHHKFNTKSHPSSEGQFTEVLSRISSLSLNTSSTGAKRKLAELEVNALKSPFMQSVATKEDRIKFISERVSWQSYANSVELSGKSKSVIDAVCDILADVTLTEDDIATSEYDADKDFYAGMSVPEITLADYLFILVQGLDDFHEETGYTKSKGKGVGVRSLVMALVYLGRIKEREKNFVLTVYNQHRLFAVTMLLAVKMTEDESIMNMYWADISGLDVDDLNEVEAEFCRVVDFDLLASEGDLLQIYNEFGLTTFLN